MQDDSRWRYTPNAVAGAADARPGRAATRWERSRQRGGSLWWGLPLVLAVQAALSLTLLSRPAVQDETTYLVAGHAQIAHWLHGTPVPHYAEAFSGRASVLPAHCGAR